ncbi:MAG: glutathione S-transferase family protein [Bosea sp. (in: a-proteobacteria)]
MIIWGRLNSVNVQKVVWAAGECGVAFERRDAGMHFGINSSADYKAKNPNGLIPLVEDGETIIWESHAIIRYLAAKYAAGRLWAHDPAERSSADRWMDWTATVFNPAMNSAFHQTVRTPPEKRDEALIAASIAQTEAKLALLDAHLTGHEFLAGQHFTMAECALGPFIHRWLNMPVERQPHAHVSRWYETIRIRPAAVSALQLPVT